MRTRADVLRAEAEQWMDDNPRIFMAFEDAAMEEVHAGRRFGMKALAEGIRWNSRLHWAGPYKIPAAYVSFIGRRLLELHPEIAMYCHFAELRSEREAA